MKISHNILIKKSENKRPLCKPRSRWEDKIKLGLIERVCVKFWIGFKWFRTGIL
jgi:hypothetical protein